MRFIKPVWLTHSGDKKDFEVYSCHVSPDGSRLVTAAGDGHVRIWSTDAIYNAADPNYARPKQLASMSYHSGTIHTVRFASNGRFLASGADDKIVCVYALDPNPPSHTVTFGSNEAPPVENWRISRRLIGHDNDVQDLGWSYDASILVSVGLDSKVVIWSGHTFEKLKTISSHQSHVKGVTFDPANKFFATASDDRTIRIWRFTSPGPNTSAHDSLNNFSLEKTISSPFTASPLTTYFRRCAWSPDGAHIAAANAVNGPVSSVAIINRHSWDGDIHLIGHEGPVEVCSFSPRLFTPRPPSTMPRDAEGNLAHTSTVIACAGQDKALSIWITTNPRPLVITQDVTVKSISDLAWTPDGRSLFLTSLDGTILCVSFNASELGFEVPLEENELKLSKYGAGRKGAGIVEGPSGLLLEEKSKEGELRGVQGRMGALMGDGASTQAPNVYGANGLLVNGSANGTNMPNGHTSEPPTEPATSEAIKPPSAPDANNQKLEKLKNRVTITKDGKKRIAPLLVSSSGGQESSLPRAQMMLSSSTAKGAATDAPQTILDLSKPFDGLPRGGLASFLLGNKRKLAAAEGDDEGHAEKRIAMASKDGAVPIMLNTVDGLVPARPLPAPTGLQPIPEVLRPAVTNPSLSTSQLRLAVPKVRSHIVQSFPSTVAPTDAQLNGTGDRERTANATAQTSFVFEARNPSQLRVQDQEPCRVTVTKRGLPVWQDYLPRSALLLTGNQRFWSIACEDGSIYVWSHAGRRIVNAMVLESQPVILNCWDQWLLCITAVGMCYVWDIVQLTSPHPPVSLAPVLDIAVHSLSALMTKGPSITSGRVNSEGRIVVTLSNGDGYAYSPSMYIWQRLSEVWWAIGSQFWNSTDTSVGNLRSSTEARRSSVSAGIIPYLERSTTTETLLRGRAYPLQRLVKQLLSREGFEGFESSVSIAHLENRVAAAMMLGAKDDFQTYLSLYARQLASEGSKTKVQELLRSLHGSVHESEDPDLAAGSENPRNAPDRKWDSPTGTICGWPREDLLRSVILLLGKSRELQRITVPYAQLLDMVDIDYEDLDMVS
ncbi:MAG: hypothetical protein Q9191_002222 [Dirinaria sp. TL-2023a]